MRTSIVSFKENPMPMIDVYAPADLFPADADATLGDELTHAVLRAEGVASPGPFHLDNTAAFIHRLPASAISTASTPSSRTVRVQIITPPGSLKREGQHQLVREATEIVSSDRRRRRADGPHLGDPVRGCRGWLGPSWNRVRGRGVRGACRSSRRRYRSRRQRLAGPICARPGSGPMLRTIGEV